MHCYSKKVTDTSYMLVILAYRCSEITIADGVIRPVRRIDIERRLNMLHTMQAKVI